MICYHQKLIRRTLGLTVSSHGDQPMDICNDSLTIESYGFSQRCAESNILERDSRRFEKSIMGSGHTFPNVVKFHDVVYLMSIASRFRYYFKRNSMKHMTVVCTVNECPWKVTAHESGIRSFGFTLFETSIIIVWKMLVHPNL